MSKAIAAPLITGATGLGSSMMGAYAQEKISDEEMKRRMQMSQEQIAAQKEMQERALREQGRQFDITDAFRRQAYLDALKSFEQAQSRAGELGTTGEQAFLEEAGQPLPELGQMQQDILSGESEALQRGAGQLQAGLAQQGVRGAQAAELLRRGVGDITQKTLQDINRMKFGEAGRRQAERLAFQRAKAQLGQQGILSRM